MVARTLEGLLKELSKRVGSLERRLSFASPTIPDPPDPPDWSYLALVARNRNRIINGNFRTNQKSVTSGVALAGPLEYGFDRWRTSGNLLRNSSFEVDLSDWDRTSTTHTLSRTTAQHYDGVAALASTTLSSGNTVAYLAANHPRINPGQTATFTIYMKGSVAKSVTPRIQWLDANKALLSQSDGSAVTSSISTWTRIVVTAVAPASAVYMGVLAFMSSAVAGDVLYLDAAMLTRTASAVPYTAPTTLTFVTAPQGQMVTVAGEMQQPIERENIEAGDYALSQAGTSLGRVYNAGDTPPAYAACPLSVTLDGLTDVIVEFSDGTVGEVQLERGSTPTPFERIPVGQELALCQRYFWRRNAASNDMMMFAGTQNSTTQARASVYSPVPLRGAPIIRSSGLGWGDARTFSVAVSTLTVSAAGGSGFDVRCTFPAAGTAGASGFFVSMNATAWIELDAEL